MAGVNIFDLAATISADTRRFDASIKSTQAAIQQARDRLKELAKESNSPFKTAQMDALRARIKELAERYKELTKAQKESAKAQKESASAMKDDLGGALQAISPRFAAFAASGGPIALGAAAFVAMAAAGAILSKQLLDLTLSTADWQGKLFDMSQQSGVGVEMLSGLEVAFSTTGGNIDTATQSLIIFQSKMADAGEATSETGKLFKELGITSGETDEALRQAVKGLAKVEEGFERTDKARELFGRGAKAFLAITEETNGDLEKLIDKLRAMGVLLSGDAAKAADEFNDQLTILQYQARAVGAEIGQQMMPSILGGLKSLSNLLSENQAAIQLMGSAVRVLIAQPLEAWLRGNFYWLNMLGDALNFVTSRTWSIEYQFVNLGGLLPFPVPTLTGTVKPEFGQPAGAGLGKPRGLGGGGRGGGKGGGGKKDIDEVAEALKRQKIEIDNAILGTDRYDQEINKLIESLKSKKKAIDEDQLALLRKNAATLHAIEAEKTYREFMQGLHEELFDATHQTDEWDKALRSLEKQLAKNKASLDDFVGAEHRDIIAKLRLIDLLKKEAIAMQELTITRLRYAEVLRNTRPRMVGVPENEDVSVTDLGGGSIYVRDTKVPGVDSIPGQTRPRRATPDPYLEQYEKMRRLAESLTSLISDSLSVGFQKGMKAGLVHFAQGILDMIQAKILNKLTDAITDALMRGFGNAQGAGGGSGGGLGALLGIGGTILSGILGGIGGGGGSWGKLGGKIGFPTPVKLAQGMDYVPYDGFLASLHRGERVVPASENSTGGRPITIIQNINVPNIQAAGSRDTQRQVMGQYRRMMQAEALAG